jgi:hypothetical protein
MEHRWDKIDDIEPLERGGQRLGQGVEFDESRFGRAGGERVAGSRRAVDQGNAWPLPLGERSEQSPAGPAARPNNAGKTAHASAQSPIVERAPYTGPT